MAIEMNAQLNNNEHNILLLLFLMLFFPLVYVPNDCVNERMSLVQYLNATVRIKLVFRCFFFMFVGAQSQDQIKV